MKLPNMPKLPKKGLMSETEKSEYIISFLLEYTGPFYSFLNYSDRGLKESFRLLHEKPYDNRVSIENIVEFVDEFIENSHSWPVALYRGVNVSQRELDEYLSESTISMNGLSSWTRDPKIAEMYSEGSDMRVVYVLKENKTAASIAHLSMFYGEQEFLAPTTSKYKMTNKETRDGILYIHLEEEIKGNE